MNESVTLQMMRQMGGLGGAGGIDKPNFERPQTPEDGDLPNLE